MKPAGWSRRRFLEAGGVVAGSLALGAAPVRAQAKRRLALVGTGIRGVNLWGRHLRERYADRVEFAGLCDVNPGRLEFARGYIGAECPTFTDFGQMLDSVRPERVIVTTVDSTHHRFIVAALEQGCDVITEKPMTTDEEKCQQILDACRRTGRDLVVTFNYRYAPHREKMKQLLVEGAIGRLTSVDFHWYLDVHHGADYFRRWHGRERFSGTLFVHKACHHFDLLNWWIGSEPEEVYARGGLEFYGHNHSFRHDQCRGCPHREECDFYWDVTREPHLVDLYVRNEHHDGYIRDGCVWSEEIDIFDKMAAQIRYASGVQVSYSCTTYSPYEGYRIAFNGTRGRLEAWIKERQPWAEPARDELRLTDNFGESRLIRIPHGGGGHAGGDDRMLEHIFGEAVSDPLGQAAGVRDGAMSSLLGIAARTSARSGRPVRIADLSTLTPRPVR